MLAAPDARKPSPSRNRTGAAAQGIGAGEPVVLVADVDLLTDGAAVEVQEVFGQKLIVPRNGNLTSRRAWSSSSRATQNLIGCAAALVHAAAHGDPADGIARRSSSIWARSRSSRTRSTRRRRSCRSCRRASAAGARHDPHARAAGRNRELQEEDDRDPQGAERGAQEPARRNRALQFWTKVVNIGLVPLLVALIWHCGGNKNARRMIVEACRRTYEPQIVPDIVGCVAVFGGAGTGIF